MAELRRQLQTAWAFTRMGFLLEISYPIAFFMTQLHSLLPLLTYYFVDKAGVFDRDVGGDYFTFVVIGILTSRIIITGINDLSRELDEAIQQGRFEMLLVEPIRWRLLPFGMVQWPLVLRLSTGAFMGAMALVIGADLRITGIPLALLLTLAGTVATLAIGVVAMSVKVLSKRSDPVLAVYVLVGQLLSGVYFPLEVLPGPLRALSYLLPQTYVISANRQVLMRGGEEIGGPTPLVAFFALAIFAVIVYTAGLWLLGRSLDYARRIGVLGGY